MPMPKRFTNLIRALGIVWDCAPLWTIINILVIIISALLGLASLYVNKYIIDSVTYAGANFDASTWKSIILAIGLACAIAIAMIILNIIQGLSTMRQSQAVTTYAQDIIHSKSIEVDLEFYDNPGFYDSLHNAQQEAVSRPAAVVNTLISLGSNGFALITLGGLLMMLNLWVAAILILAAIPGIIVRFKYSRKEYEWILDYSSSNRKLTYLNWLITGGSYAKEIRMFDSGQFFKRQFSDLKNKIDCDRFKFFKKRSIIESLAQASTIIASFCALAYFAYNALLGAITVGAMVMYFQAFQQSQGIIQNIFGLINNLHQNDLFLSNLFEFIDLEKKVAEPLNPTPFPKIIRNGIEFKNVNFDYPGSSRVALNNLNIKIAPNSIVALVGGNGSGKTTLIKLLCRLYDPTAGTISIDGIDIRQFQTSELRRAISITFQDYANYDLTAWENIWIGDMKLPSKHEKILEASRRSGADEVIGRLKNRYESNLGKWLEDGEQISTGEWQKIAVARAFLRASQIIILDESTSSIDPLAEAHIFKNIRELAANRCIFLVSHRLSVAMMADYIYVLHEGKIIETGTHDDLIQRDGNYAKMFGTQSKNS